jgi:hypothetical protein
MCCLYALTLDSPGRPDYSPRRLCAALVRIPASHLYAGVVSVLLAFGGDIPDMFKFRKARETLLDEE